MLDVGSLISIKLWIIYLIYETNNIYMGNGSIKLKVMNWTKDVLWQGFEWTSRPCPLDHYIIHVGFIFCVRELISRQYYLFHIVVCVMSLSDKVYSSETELSKSGDKIQSSHSSVVIFQTVWSYCVRFTVMIRHRLIVLCFTKSLGIIWCLVL